MSAPIKAMILAAGRGERMRPLTDHTPKPLLEVRGQALIEWHAQALARGGFHQLVINTAWLGEQIASHFELQLRQTRQPGQDAESAGDAQHDGLGRLDTQGGRDGKNQPGRLSIAYSHEGVDFGGALETAGGIARALPLLGEVFWVLAGDVFVPGFEFSPAAVSRFVSSDKLAHLWLVPNPAHNPRGDFGLSEGGLALNLPPESEAPRYTYSTIGLYRRALFEALPDLPVGNPHGVKAALAPLLRAAMNRGQISAELYEGDWTDVGTPARLAELNQNV